MQKPSLGRRFALPLKVIGIIFLALLMGIPLAMVRDLIAERAANKDGVVADIARTAADTQRITLPVIVVPYTRRWVATTETVDDKLNKKTVSTEKTESGTVQFLPEQVGVTAAPVMKTKKRGLYQVQTYVAALKVSGRFSLPKDYGYAPAEGTVTWGAPVLAFGVSDPRGINNNPVLAWGGGTVRFAPGSGGDLTRIGSGISATLPQVKPDAAQDAEFSFTVDLTGMERLSFIPTGRETRVTLDADWGHPSFFGKFSPDSQIGSNHFSANWQTSFFSTNAKQAYATCAGSAKCEDFTANEFGVSFIQPVNLYLQLERAAKYGFLFVGLTFAAFFLFEVLRSLAVHPLQYGLVGLALAMFFLLLVSLSEHIGFVQAYAVASLACVGLIVAYLSAVLGNWWRALGIGALLAGLYGVLYMLLISEDNALLMGSLFLFGLLAAAMLATRRVDWYGIGRRNAEPEPEPA
ncbi:MAG TPA: cell envelope integrity protein CreD [Burkholderiales bacterium]|jgi:inner membrane protein